MEIQGLRTEHLNSGRNTHYTISKQAQPDQTRNHSTRLS